MTIRCVDPVTVRFGEKSMFEYFTSMIAKSPSPSAPVAAVAKQTANGATVVSVFGTVYCRDARAAFARPFAEFDAECAAEQSTRPMATESPLLAMPANVNVFATPANPTIGEYVGFTERSKFVYLLAV
jgi:hypothetical protein